MLLLKLQYPFLIVFFLYFFACIFPSFYFCFGVPGCVRQGAPKTELHASRPPHSAEPGSGGQKGGPKGETCSRNLSNSLPESIDGNGRASLGCQLCHLFWRGRVAFQREACSYIVATRDAILAGKSFCLTWLDIKLLDLGHTVLHHHILPAVQPRPSPSRDVIFVLLPFPYREQRE